MISFMVRRASSCLSVDGRWANHGLFGKHWGRAKVKLDEPGARADVTPKQSAVILAALVILGVVLRSVAIGRESLWSDEALTLVLAQWPVWDMITKPTDPTPFVYYALHKWFVPENAGVVGVRSISLLAGILALPVMYVIGRRMFSRRGALLATALLTVSAPLIEYSQEARAYSVLVLLGLISAAALLSWFEVRNTLRNRRVALAVFGVSTLLACYTHFSAIFWIGPAMLLLLALSWRGDPKARAEVLVTLAMLNLAMIPEWIRAASYASTGPGLDWLHQATPTQFVEVIRDTLLPIGFGTDATAGLLIPVAIWIGWRSYADRKRLRGWISDRPAAAAVIVSLLMLPLVVWLFGYVATPVFVPRTILLAIPGSILLFVLLIELDQSNIRQIATSATFIALCVTSLMTFGTARPKEDWREVRRILSEQSRPGDVLIVCPIWKYPALRHAAPEPVAMPVTAFSNEQWRILESGIAADPHWQRRYLDVTTGRSLNRGAAPEQRARKWLIVDLCAEADPDAARVLDEDIRRSTVVSKAGASIKVRRVEANDFSSAGEQH